LAAEPSRLEVDAVRDRLAAVRAAVHAAAVHVGRDPADIRIVAVTKTFPASTVAAAVAAGLTDVGENYVQEARAKRAGVTGAVWHLIGGLQRNKLRAALAVFDCVQTVDSVALADALGAAAAGRRLPVLVQVNVAGEATKRGVPPEHVEGVATAILSHPTLLLEGLMTVPPAGEPEASRPHFRALRELRNRTQVRVGVELPHLSMGMSSDFTVAVEEGATWLRLGRALFGGRDPAAGRPGPVAAGEGS
jgi:pyridoxal phosphate enzyme (YggS family)